MPVWRTVASLMHARVWIETFSFRNLHLSVKQITAFRSNIIIMAANGALIMQDCATVVVILSGDSRQNLSFYRKSPFLCALFERFFCRSDREKTKLHRLPFSYTLLLMYRSHNPCGKSVATSPSTKLARLVKRIWKGIMFDRPSCILSC